MCVKSPGLPPGLANAQPPGCAKLAKAPPPGLTRLANALQLPGGGGGGWAQVELTDAYGENIQNTDLKWLYTCQWKAPHPHRPFFLPQYAGVFDYI